MPKVLNFKVLIEKDEDGYFVASVPAVPGCHTQGDSYDQAVKNIKEAIKLCLEEAKENSDYKQEIQFPSKKSESLIDIINLPVRLAY
ncbi:MAG: type II toxin-antitoxin system HicB family antitoxin [Patescibacteria group bacterium]